MEEPRQKKMAVIASKGTLDMAYPPFILATTAAALGWEVQIFFTFYGLQIIHKTGNKHLQVPSIGNPAMKRGAMVVPSIVGVLPGIGPVATLAMLLPFTFGLGTAPALIMLAGIY